jgi:hypothetical protein
MENRPRREQKAGPLPMPVSGATLGVETVGIWRISENKPEIGECRFIYRIPDQRIDPAVEDVERVGRVGESRAVAGGGVQPGQSSSVAAALVDVAAGMNESRVAAVADAGGVGCRECVAPEDFGPEFEELFGGREPAQLHAVIVILRIEKHSVWQRCIDEVPGV